MLKKSNKPDREKVKSYRTISLLSCLGKVVEKVMTDEIADLVWIELPDVCYSLFQICEVHIPALSGDEFATRDTSHPPSGSGRDGEMRACSLVAPSPSPGRGPEAGSLAGHTLRGWARNGPS